MRICENCISYFGGPGFTLGVQSYILGVQSYILGVRIVWGPQNGEMKVTCLLTGLHALRELCLDNTLITDEGMASVAGEHS